MAPPEVPLSPIPIAEPARLSGELDETLIRTVVDDFYATARRDALLGPVFERRVDDWAQHMPRMYAFWAKALLQRAGYTGDPFAKHAPISELAGEHFVRWLELFAAAIGRHCEAPDAAIWERLARRMGYAMCLRQGLGDRRELLG